MTLFDFAQKEKRIEEINAMMLEDGFWNDRRASQNRIDEANGLKDLIETYRKIEKSVNECSETEQMLKESYDEEIFMLLEEEYEELQKDYEDFEISVLLSHPYDKNNAILEFHPGAGGTESQDWAEMLFRMYTRWAEKHNFKVTTLDYQDGDEAGIKSASLLIQGRNAYGYLKSEKGVHRLVRISPFDANAKRHTSFAAIDVMPEFDEAIDITIDEADLIMETHRSSGAGGQHINKTDSAVRLIHKPTGLVANCQSERSQLMNKERALNMLKSKLYQLKIEEQEAKVNALKGEQKSIEWGAQIRSYVFMPYTLVKDNRTGYENGNVNAVMDGDLDGFIHAYLKSQIQ